MSWLDRITDQADQLAEARVLQVNSRSAEACALLERVIAATTDPYTRADAMVQRISGLLNLGRTAECTGAVDEAFAVARPLADAYLTGHLHALAALAAHHQGALDRCVTHLVQSSRSLDAVQEYDAPVAWAWHDLAMAYSYLGFHGYALSAIDQARRIGANAGIGEETLAAPGIRLRNAVSLDHSGDTDGCLRVLRELAAELDGFRRGGGLRRLRPSTRAAYGYAVVRRAALGEAADPPVAGPDGAELLADGGDSSRSRDLRQLGQVCQEIAAGRPIEALARLETVTVAPETLGAAEQARLRSLICSRAGDHAAAHRADRHAFRLAAQRNDRLRDVYVEGIAARLDAEEMRRSAAQYAGEALSDPLTGLPNRQRLERHVAALLARGERAMVGVCDLSRFAAVNAEHGHHSGDLVLQRIAGVINRVLRRGDLVARYGGDEFVVVLPGAGRTQADEVSQRISAAVGAEDWQSLVPGTAVTVTMAWTQVGDRAGDATRSTAELNRWLADRTTRVSA